MHVFFWTLAFLLLFLAGFVGLLTGVGRLPVYLGLGLTVLTFASCLFSAWMADVSE